MGVATGCGLKEIYRFPHTTYPYTPLVSVLFCSSIPTFLFIFYIYISGRTSFRKCSKCFYVYLNIRPMRYSAM